MAFAMLWSYPSALDAQVSCSSNTIDPAYNDACAVCDVQEFVDIWICNA